MSGEPSKINADITWAKGKFKETLGGVMGNEAMRTEGTADVARGNAEYESALAKGYAEGTSDKVVGTVKEKANSALGDDAGKAEGSAQRMKGDAQRKANA